MNRSLLKSIMALHNDTVRELAEFLGITPNSVSNKINENGTEFKQGEIAMIKERYNLSADQVDEIFLADGVKFRHGKKRRKHNDHSRAIEADGRNQEEE